MPKSVDERTHRNPRHPAIIMATHRIFAPSMDPNQRTTLTPTLDMLIVNDRPRPHETPRTSTTIPDSAATTGRWQCYYWLPGFVCVGTCIHHSLCADAGVQMLV